VGIEFEISNREKLFWFNL